MNEEPAASERLSAIQSAMAAAAKRAKRDVDDITLIAISKTREAEDIEPLIAAGQRAFGENRVQEATAKWPALRERHSGLSLHFVGQLQSNKAADAVQLFDCIHSLDRSSLITPLANAMDKYDRRVPLFIQVNIGEEPQKAGCAIAELPTLLGEAAQADLPIAGLMAVPPLDREPAPYFALLAKVARDHGLSGLSMGMSGDFESAITIGATHIRVGTALFGARN